MNANDQLQFDPTKAWLSQTLAHERQVTRCRYSPGGDYLAAGGTDFQIQCWELASGTKTTLAGHESWIGDLAFHPDGERLFAADYRGVVHCWRHRQPADKPLWSIAPAHQGWIRALAVSPDGKLLATAGNDRVVKLWSTEGGQPAGELTGHAGYVFSLAFHPAGQRLVSGDLQGAVCEWDVAASKLVRTLDAKTLHTRLDDFIADVGGVRALAFDREGQRLACGGMTKAQSNTFCPGDPLVLVFDWATGQVQQSLRVKQKADGPINAVKFLSDGSLAGYGESSGGASLSFWKLDQPEAYHSVAGASGYDLDLHPDGLRLAVATFEAKGRTGNGRHSDKQEYVPNGGAVRIYSLHAKT